MQNEALYVRPIMRIQHAIFFLLDSADLALQTYLRNMKGKWICLHKIHLFCPSLGEFLTECLDILMNATQNCRPDVDPGMTAGLNF